jgi:predicted RND superfamily exporter protein
MIPFICRIIEKVYIRPHIVLGVFFVFWLFMLSFCFHSHMSLSILDLMNSENSVLKNTKLFESQKGSFHEFDIVLKNSDSAKNLQSLHLIDSALSAWDAVERIEFKTEVDFFEQNKLLYIDLEDLQTIYDRTYEQWSAFSRKNPFVVDIDDNDSLKEDTNLPRAESFFLGDIAQKYVGKQNKYFGNSEKTLLVIKVFPTKNVQGFLDLKRFYERLKTRVNSQIKDSQTEVYYGGEGVEFYKTQGGFQNAVTRSLWITLGLWFILFGLYFRKQKALFPALVAPFVFSGVSTLALVDLIIGQVNLMTILFGALIGSFFFQTSLHLLNRYQEERKKQLSSKLSFSSIALETGPALIFALAGFCLGLYPLFLFGIEGVKEFAISLMIALVVSGISTLLLTPSLILVLQRQKISSLKVSTQTQPLYIHENPFPLFKSLIAICVFSAISFWAFTQTSFQVENKKQVKYVSIADSLLKSVHIENKEPFVVFIHSSQERIWIQNALQEAPISLKNMTSWVRSSQDLLPKDQAQKLELLQDLKSLLSPHFLKYLDENQQKMARAVLDFKADTLSVKDLPLSLQEKFAIDNKVKIEYAYIYVQADNIQAYAQVVDYLSELRFQGKKLEFAGNIFLFYEMVNQVSKHTNKVLWATAIIWILWLLMWMRKSKLLVFVMLIGGAFIVFLLNVFSELSHPLVALVSPVYLGYIGWICIPIYSRSLEEGTGSLLYVYRTTGKTAMLSILIGASCFVGYVFSEHPALQSFGWSGLFVFGGVWFTSHFLLPIALYWRECKQVNSRTTKD